MSWTKASVLPTCLRPPPTRRSKNHWAGGLTIQQHTGQHLLSAFLAAAATTVVVPLGGKLALICLSSLPPIR